MDFQDNTELIGLVHKFAAMLGSSGMLSAAEQLEKLLSKMVRVTMISGSYFY